MHLKITPKNLLIAAMAAGWAYDVRVGKRYQKRYKDAKLAAATYRDMSQRFETMIHFYAAKLDQHQIPLDEFDEIAVNEILNIK